MKKISAFLALITLFFAGLALAQNTAVVTSTTGTASVQTGQGPSRTLRVGDELRQGDTVFTGAGSSVVLKFDDGQVAALTQNSRMVISRYQYNPSSGTGNVLLSLVNGGMRAITGLIGRRAPENVAYRAATATIGIRGTDVTIATDGTNTVVVVNDGSITFTAGGKTIVVSAGQAVIVRADGTFQTGPASQILSQLTPGLVTFITGVDALNSAIQSASAGIPRDGSGPSSGPTPGNTGGPTGGGAGGGLTGGPASPS
jgi:hypothetical protein